jgi:predicted nucleic acid-binding protein
LPGRVCRDADDDLVLAAALAAKADAIVTGDQDLLVLKRFKGIPILNPRDCLALLAAD